MWLNYFSLTFNTVLTLHILYEHIHTLKYFQYFRKHVNTFECGLNVRKVMRKNLWVFYSWRHPESAFLTVSDDFFLRLYLEAFVLFILPCARPDDTRWCDWTRCSATATFIMSVKSDRQKHRRTRRKEVMRERIKASHRLTSKSTNTVTE